MGCIYQIRRYAGHILRLKKQLYQNPHDTAKQYLPYTTKNHQMTLSRKNRHKKIINNLAKV